MFHRFGDSANVPDFPVKGVLCSCSSLRHMKTPKNESAGKTDGMLIKDSFCGSAIGSSSAKSLKKQTSARGNSIYPGSIPRAV